MAARRGDIVSYVKAEHEKPLYASSVLVAHVVVGKMCYSVGWLLTSTSRVTVLEADKLWLPRL